MPSELPDISTAEASTMWEYYGLDQNASFLRDNRIWSYSKEEGKYADSDIQGYRGYKRFRGGYGSQAGWDVRNLYDLDKAKEIGAGAPFGGYAPKISYLRGVDNTGTIYGGMSGTHSSRYKYNRYKKVDQGYGRWKHKVAMEKLEREAEEARLLDRRKMGNIRAKGLILENTMKKRFSTRMRQQQDVMDIDVADSDNTVINKSKKFDKKKWRRIARAAKVASTGKLRRPI